MHACMCTPQTCKPVYMHRGCTGRTIRSCGGRSQSVMELPCEPALIPPHCATSFDDCHREFQQLSLPHHQILESVGGQMASASLCSVRAVWLCPFLPFIAFSSVPTYHLVPQLMQSSRHNFDSINIGSTHVGHTCSKKEMISFYWCLIILIVWFFFFVCSRVDDLAQQFLI